MHTTNWQTKQRSKQREVNKIESKNRPFLALIHEKESPRLSFFRAWKIHLLSFFFSLSLFNATSNGPRPPVLWCPVFRLSVFVRLTSAFFPSFVTTRVFAGGKLSCTGIINFSYPRRRASPRFHPAWTYFRRSTFFVSRTGRGRGREERFLTKKRRKWTNVEWTKDRRKLWGENWTSG